MHRVWAVLLLFSGCAFGLSGPDPDAPRSKMPRCDTSKGLVALDGVMAVTAGVVALALAGNNESGVALLPLSIGGVYAAGAISGNTKVNKCREALDDYENYAAARETLPATGDDDTPRALAPPGPAMQPPSVAPPVAAPPPASVAVAPPQPVVAPPVQPVAAAPSPVPAAPVPVAAAPATAAPAAAPAKKPAAKPQPQQDDWSDFWREIE